jgi:UDP-N-acetylglucosamine 2-epimerase (non-hydrolysing)
MKAAPVIQALNQLAFRQLLIHTGQHYDASMSDAFFQQLSLPNPDINLGVGSGSHAQQTADVMIGFEKFIGANRPDLLVVYGDVNSTMAASLVAAKAGIPIAHVEAGLRSFDRTMPEEINRIVTDCLATLFFTPSADADANLKREGIAADQIHLVGNVMIDTLIKCLPMANANAILAPLGIGEREPYILVTLHRPSSVDDPALLAALVDVLNDLAKQCPVIFPVHPRTRAKLADAPRAATLHLLDPVGYLEFVGLEQHARLVITDSGGVQEETTYLGVPCLTVRDNTERPVTISDGTNRLAGRDPQTLRTLAKESLESPIPKKRIPALWDGHASERIAAVIAKELS